MERTVYPVTEGPYGGTYDDAGVKRGVHEGDASALLRERARQGHRAYRENGREMVQDGQKVQVLREAGHPEVFRLDRQGCAGGKAGEEDQGQESSGRIHPDYRLSTGSMSGRLLHIAMVCEPVSGRSALKE